MPPISLLLAWPLSKSLGPSQLVNSVLSSVCLTKISTNPNWAHRLLYLAPQSSVLQQNVILFFIFLSFSGTGNWSWDLALARQVHMLLSHAPGLVLYLFKPKPGRQCCRFPVSHISCPNRQQIMLCWLFLQSVSKSLATSLYLCGIYHAPGHLCLSFRVSH